jgi:signal transduction histidine kinase
LSQKEIRFPLARDGFFQPVIERGESVFCERTADLISRGLPNLGRSLLGRLVRRLGLERSIYAPLMEGGEIWGVLCLGGTDLTAQDVPAVTVFANQASIALENARLLEELEAGRRQLRRLAHEVVGAQELERRRLSSALHDETGQALTALRLSLDLIGEDLPPECGSLRQRVGDAADLTAATMNRIRTIVQDLRPPALDALGLNPALEEACRDFGQRTKLTIGYSGAVVPALPDEINISLYRFLQEALTNVARHAKATRVEVALDCDAETVSLSVEDDGRGFDPQASPEAPGGIGLLGMRERVESLGGRLDLRSEPGRGTLLVTNIPLKEAVP